jgi:uncharacterized protein (UPF0335 family)
MQPSLVERCPSCGARIIQRNTEQNSALHAKISDIAHQLEWPANSGQRLTVEQWKRLLIAAWDRSQGSSADFFPALEGHGFDVVYRRSSRLSKQDASELLEYVTAWGTDQGVKWQKETA